MRKIILLSIVSIFSSIVVFAQISDKRERIYLHTNNSTLISGETLVFGAYVLSELTGKPSHVSNQVYVELINEKESVYKTKIEITEGVGSGKIFIPSMLSTGRYYLVAYTRWMKNFDDRFTLPIDVYNPFESLKNDSITTNKPFISFYTSSGKIVAEKVNTIGFEIKHEGTPKREFKGRIQNNAGETVAEIIPDKNNMGSIEIKPSLEKYQVILEEKGGAGGFFFFDFPSISPNGLTLNINEKTDAFLIELNSSGRTDEGSICVSNTSGNYLKKQVILTGTTLIPKDELLTGLSEVTVLDNKQDTLARKMIYLPETFIFNTVQVSGERKTRSKMEAKTLLPAGNYSISIRKKFENLVSPTIPSPFSRLNASPYYHAITQNKSDNKEIETFLMSPKALLNFQYRDEVDYLPESGRELLSGSIYGNDNSPISNEIVTMTIPGPEFQLQTAKTNEKGQFTFLYDSPDTDTKVYIGTQTARENINFNIENKWLNNLPKLEYPKLNADSIQILEIVERSIQIQLLNAFEETDTDSIWYSPIEEFAPYSFFFNLDEYNRFPTLKDHFIEYIPTVGIRKDRFKFFLKFVFKENSFPHLLLLDGVPVSDEKILDFNPYKIETIALINNRYFLGPLVADGVVSMTTFDGNMSDFNPENSVYSFTLEKLNKPLNFNNPTYPNPALKNIPDKRVQLFWKGPFKTTGENTSVEFYTSDLTGKFEIVIEGFTDEGIPISSKTEFEVNK